MHHPLDCSIIFTARRGRIPDSNYSLLSIVRACYSKQSLCRLYKRGCIGKEVNLALARARMTTYAVARDPLDTPLQLYTGKRPKTPGLRLLRRLVFGLQSC